MPAYRYLTYDLLSNSPLGSVPLSGVSFSKPLSATGTLNGKLFMRDDRIDPKVDYEAITQEKRTALFAERAGTLVWGGILWTRSYSKSTRIWSIGASTFDSYADHRLVHSVLSYTSQDLLAIVTSLWGHLQNDDPNSNIGLQMPSPTPSCGETGTLTLDPTQSQSTYGQLLQQLYGGDPGFDWSTTVAWNTSTPPVPTRSLRLGTPRLGLTVDQSGLIFRHPGNVQDYTWPGDGTRSPNQMVGIGGGTGGTQLLSPYVNQSELDAGYPLVEEVVTFKNVFDQGRLNSLTRGRLASIGGTMVTPTLILRPDLDNPPLGSYNEGDDVRLVIDPDERFPNGLDDYFRITSISVSAPDHNSQAEQVTLTLGPAI